MTEQNLNIIIRFSASINVGSGHFFHSLSLFQEFQSQKIQTSLLLKKCDNFAYDKLNKLNIHYLI